LPASDAVPNASGPTPTITYDEFMKVDIRVGTIIEAAPYPEARKPTMKLKIDFGPKIGVKKSSAQLTVHYSPEKLIGRQVAAVVNFPPRQIGKFVSDVLTLGFPDDKGAVVLVAPDQKVPNGGRLFYPAPTNWLSIIALARPPAPPDQVQGRLW